MVKYLVILLAVFPLHAWAMRLVPDPALPEGVVRQYLSGRITTQPASLGDLKFTATRLTPLRVALVCDAELVLNENFYVVVPRSDQIFAAVTDRLAELDQAQEQLNLVPKDFIASLGGPKSSTSLSFLKHTFVRTTVPAQTRARVSGNAVAIHNGRFFSGKWTLADCPTLEVTAWQGRRLAEFANPLAVDTPDFAKQLSAFLDTAKKTLDEVERISNLYIAKADEERAALFQALPVGAVLSVRDASAENQPLFIEVRSADQKSGEIGFTVSSSFVSRPARAEVLRGIHPDAASALRATMERHRQAESMAAQPAPAPVSVAVVEEASNVPTKSVPIEISARQALAGTQSVQLSLSSGQAALQVARVERALPLQRIPDDEISAHRALFRKEIDELFAITEKGRIFQGVIDGTSYLLGIFSGEGNERVFILQAEVDNPTAMKIEAALLDVERDHAVFQLNLGRQRLGANWYASMELGAKGPDLLVFGKFGTAQFQPVTGKSILASGRIVTNEMAAFLNALARNAPGLYLHPESQFVPVATASAPEKSAAGAFGNALLGLATVGLGSLPTVTLQFPATAPVTRLKRDAALYALKLSGQLYALPLTKAKSTYTFVANRGSRGYVPRQQDFVPGLVPRQLDDDIHSISISGVKEEGVLALVQSNGDGERVYYLVQIEP